MTTQLERDYIDYTLEQLKQVTANAASMDLKAGTYVGNHKEAARLIESPDYNAGWKACYAQLAQYLKVITAGNRETMEPAVEHFRRQKRKKT